jgi:hypothetical protein
MERGLVKRWPVSFCGDEDEKQTERRQVTLNSPSIQLEEGLLSGASREMTSKEWETLGVQTYGLPSDLIVPIAAADLKVIETYVGSIWECLPGRKRPTNAVVVVAHRPIRPPRGPALGSMQGRRVPSTSPSIETVMGPRGLSGYRRAWKRLGFGELTRKVFLDHIRPLDASQAIPPHHHRNRRRPGPGDHCAISLRSDDTGPQTGYPSPN